METVERNKLRYFTATSPDRLLSLLRDRKDYVENQLSQLEQAIPSLFGPANTFSTIETKTVRGLSLVKEALLDLLREKPTWIVAVGDIEQVLRTNIGTSRWAQQFRDKRIESSIPLRISVQGPPDLFEEKALLRETLSSPDIPVGALALATQETVLVLDLSQSLQATRFRSELFCSILHGLYASWRGAVQRVA